MSAQYNVYNIAYKMSNRRSVHKISKGIKDENIHFYVLQHSALSNNMAT